MNYYELESKVLEWADEKGLLAPENYPKQFMKLDEEKGELSGSILKGKREKEKDGFGDVMVTLIILATQRGLNLTECLELAYNEIADRKGTMIDGSFVKDE